MDYIQGDEIQCFGCDAPVDTKHFFYMQSQDSKYLYWSKEEKNIIQTIYVVLISYVWNS